ncbi:MAG: hypothetical protein RJB38_2271 [Pseudomonadota bacterium]
MSSLKKSVSVVVFLFLAAVGAHSPLARGEEAVTDTPQAPRGQDTVDSQAELRRRIDVLASDLETLRLGEVAAKADQFQYGLGPAASKVYRAKSGVSLGGYGELQYYNYSKTKDSGASSGKNDQVNLQRLVMYLGYKFSDRMLFNSELEFEYGSSSGNREGQTGSWGVEFAYVDFLFSPDLNLRAGNLLVPMGFVNELHEPTIFLGVRRPDVERAILPTTWREVGAGFFGDVGSWTYRTYLISGFDAGGCRGSSCTSASPDGFSSGGIRDGRQNGSRATAEDWAWVSRLDYAPAPGSVFGFSAYLGDSGQDQTTESTPDVLTRIGEIHAEIRQGGFEFRALGAMTWISNVAELNAAKSLTGTSSVGSRQYGFYGQLGYQLSALGLRASVTPFIRFEQWDTQARVPGGFARNPANLQRSVTTGLQFKPVDQVVVTADYQNFGNAAGLGIDQFNLGLGFIF